jgi:hypothetical protein
MKCIPVRRKDGTIECARCGAPFPVEDRHLALFPGCAEDLKCIKARCVGLGVGDRLAAVLKFFGVTSYRLRKWFGIQCRCRQRQERLNRLAWQIARHVFGRLLKRRRRHTRTARAGQPMPVNPACPVHGKKGGGRVAAVDTLIAL